MSFSRGKKIYCYTTGVFFIISVLLVFPTISSVMALESFQEIVIVVDTAKRISENSPADLRKELVDFLIDRTPAGGRVALVYFGPKVTNVSEFRTIKDDSTRISLKTLASGVRFNSLRSDINEGLSRAMDILRNPLNQPLLNPIVFLITDGIADIDPASPRYRGEEYNILRAGTGIDEQRRYADRYDAFYHYLSYEILPVFNSNYWVIIPLAFSPSMDKTNKELLREIATRGRGQYYVLFEKEQFTRMWEDVTARFASVYSTRGSPGTYPVFGSEEVKIDQEKLVFKLDEKGLDFGVNELNECSFARLTAKVPAKLAGAELNASIEEVKRHKDPVSPSDFKLTDLPLILEEGEKSLELSLHVAPGIRPGSYSGLIKFSVTGGEIENPEVPFTVTVRRKALTFKPLTGKELSFGSIAPGEKAGVEVKTLFSIYLESTDLNARIDSLSTVSGTPLPPEHIPLLTPSRRFRVSRSNPVINFELSIPPAAEEGVYSGSLVIEPVPQDVFAFNNVLTFTYEVKKNILSHRFLKEKRIALGLLPPGSEKVFIVEANPVEGRELPLELTYLGLSRNGTEEGIKASFQFKLLSEKLIPDSGKIRINIRCSPDAEEGSYTGKMKFSTSEPDINLQDAELEISFEVPAPGFFSGFMLYAGIAMAIILSIVLVMLRSYYMASPSMVEGYLTVIKTPPGKEELTGRSYPLALKKIFTVGSREDADMILSKTEAREFEIRGRYTESGGIENVLYPAPGTNIVVDLLTVTAPTKLEDNVTIKFSGYLLKYTRKRFDYIPPEGMTGNILTEEKFSSGFEKEEEKVSRSSKGFSESGRISSGSEPGAASGEGRKNLTGQDIRDISDSKDSIW